MAGIAGILCSLALLIYLAYRGVTVLLVAPLMALLAVLLGGGVPVLATYTQVFMPAVGRFAVLYFPLFLLGAVFGKLMDDSGSALVIAQGIVHQLGQGRSVLAIVLACAVLTYGGVSLFVVAFAVYPIAVALFREARIPKRLIPPTIALGAFTFTMTALPGTPAIQNAIPMPYFNTTPFAAPGLGIIAGAIMLLLGMLWLSRREQAARRAGEGFGGEEAPRRPEVTKELREHAQGEGYDIMEICPDDETVCRKTPGFPVAILPVILVIALNYLLTAWVIPSMETAYLALPQYGSTTLSSVRGVWAIIGALVLSTVILIALNHGNIPSLKRSLDDGASASVLPLFNTASLVGFGAVIASLPAFAVIRDGVLGIAPGNPLVSLSIAVNLLAGITGSASGGMSIALQTLGETYLEMGRAAGISPELLHRVTSIATGGLDALPQNGAVITLLAICKLTHRDSYADIFVVAAAVPILALVVVVILGTAFGAF
ncbi:MAG: GntP family permease [Deferrisomatales bacterium]